jgi:hypothetical protein
MQKKVGWLAVVMVCLVVSNLQAGVHPLFWKNHQSRQQEARGWLDGFRKLDAQLPTLSPAEQRWLRTEYDDEINNAGGHFTKRALDATNSREFNLRIAKAHVAKIIPILSELSRPDAQDQKREVILWASLASLFMNNEFWQAIDSLVERGVIEKEINGVKQFYSLNHTLAAKYIVEEVVLRYLNGNLGK